jgi:GTPase SAR1 family protein
MSKKAPAAVPELPPLEIGKYEPSEKDSVRKWVLYGRSGSGKTYMAGTFPKPLFVDLEGGMASLLPLSREGRTILRLPASGPIVSHADFLDCLELVEQTLQEGAPFETVVFDSINQLQYLMALDIVASFDKTREYDDQLTRSDYGKLARMMETAIVRMFSLNCQVVIICGTQQQDANDTIWPALIGSKSVPNMLRLADAVGYCLSEHVSATATVPEHQLYQVSFSNCAEWVAKLRGAEVPFLSPNIYPFA